MLLSRHTRWSGNNQQQSCARIPLLNELLVASNDISLAAGIDPAIEGVDRTLVHYELLQRTEILERLVNRTKGDEFLGNDDDQVFSSMAMPLNCKMDWWPMQASRQASLAVDHAKVCLVVIVARHAHLPT